MTPKSLKIATLNIRHFDEWEKRLPLILDQIRASDPDIILFQEAERDASRDGEDQAGILNRYLGYAHAAFASAYLKTTRKGMALPNPVDHGLGIISRFPFRLNKKVLSKAADEKEQQIIVEAVIDMGETSVSLVNLHFSNTDKHSEANFMEALGIYKKADPKPILAGDFNIKNIRALKNLYSPDYVSSSDLYQYVSYPKDGLSYDHILLPSNFRFKSFECIDKSLSDHCMLVAEIELVEKTDEKE